MSWADLREEMVERQLRARGITDGRVLTAMRTIPREEFVPADERHRVYSDAPSAIGFDQTISQPYITALMAQSLALQGSETVLDVGSGSGYHAAVLSRLAARVMTIEIIPELAAFARANLQRTGLLDNVTVVNGDGSLGCASFAPYQAISVAAAAPQIPASLLDQLDDPGRLVIPVGSYTEQDLLLIEKSEGALQRRVVTGCRFVPLRGGQGWQPES